MSSDLSSEFDVVVLGTGMSESILAAAFSRIGKTVLHLDRNPYYSGDWASFNLQGIEKWTQQLQGQLTDTELVKRPSLDESSLLEEGETLIQLPLTNNHFSQPQLQYHVSQDKCQSQGDESVTIPSAVQLNQPGMETQLTSPASPASESDEKHDVSTKTDCPTSPEGDGGDVLGEHGKVAGIRSGVSKLDIEKSKNDATVIDSNKSTDQSEASQDYHDVVNELSKQDIEESGQNLPECCSEDPTTKQDNKKETESITEEADKSYNWTKEKMQSEWRRFNLDLTPKVVYSGGDMVELLITSDIAKYCEFKTVTRLLTLMNGAIEQVPCSRADVFSSKKLSMMEKRMLMKFLQTCVQFESNADAFKDYLERPFTELLTSWKPKLTANIQYYIQHSIAMATDSTTTTQALEQMKKFFKSLGRYGNTAFLWSLYGSGELPQSFCRLCAVFGGTYVLNMSVSSLIVEDKENRCTGVITTGGQKIKAKWVVMEASYAPEEYIHKEKQRHISRAIILADKPLLSSDNQELSLMTIPCPDDGERPILLLELPSSSMASPKGVYVYHLTRPSSSASSAEADLSQMVNTLFTTADDQDDDRPAILWSLYFSQLDMSSPLASDRVPDNVILMSGPGTDIDLDRPVQEAKGIFTRVLPDEEFLPKAPNPEDIIYVDDNQASVSEGSERVEYSEAVPSGETGGDNPGQPACSDMDMGTCVSDDVSGLDKTVSAVSDEVSATGDTVSDVNDIPAVVDNVSVVSDAVSKVEGHVSVISDNIPAVSDNVSMVSGNVSAVDGNVSVVNDVVSPVADTVSVVSDSV